MTKLRATTALAADIARLDRQRFNEAVASGFYPCAPATIPGRARSFGLNDLIALRVYQHLIVEGMLPRHAGHFACGLLGFLEECPDADHALQVVSDFGNSLGPVNWVRPETFQRIKDASFFGEHPIVYVRDWYLDRIRTDIVARLEEEDENRPVGPLGAEEGE